MWTRTSQATWTNYVMLLLTLTIGCTATRERFGWGRRETPLAATLPAPNPQEYQAYAASDRTAPSGGCCSRGGGCGAGSACGSQGGSCGRSAVAAVSPSAKGPSQNSMDFAATTAAQTATGSAGPYGGQKLCPVTDENLGAMGPPVPVTVKGQTIYVCCAGCVAAVEKDPDVYLAKVAQQRGAP